MSAAEQSLRDTITPKSDQLNADDLIAGPVTVRIEAVKRSASPDQPIDVMIAGHRPFRPCKSMRRVLIAVWGDQGADWVGESMTLYCDPAVKFGGVAVGGIRISHMTGIDKPVDLMLTTTRSKRSVYTVQPLRVAQKQPPAQSAPAWTYDEIIAALGSCEDAERFADLRDAGRSIYSTLDKDQKSALTKAINAVKDTLQC